MKRILRGLALMVATAMPTNSNAVLMDDGNNMLTCDGKGCHNYVSGSCEYKGLTLQLSCDLELPAEPRCIITEMYDWAGKKRPGRDFPDSLCLPKVRINYPDIEYCFEPSDCYNDFLCC